MEFLKSREYKELKKHSQKPFDLTKKHALHPDRIRCMQSSAGSLTLSYATERIENTTLNLLFSLAKEMGALEKMRSMQAGKKINKIHGYSSENRAVLHTAMRDFFADRNPNKSALVASEEEFAEWKKLEAFLEELEKKSFRNIVQIGIGGSYLGPEAMYIALDRYRKKKRSAHFISNVDPDDAISVLRRLDLAKTLVVVVSKSGSTLETKTNEILARKYYEQKGLATNEHFIAVTGKKSPMDNPKKYLRSFYMEDYVGGRYSVCSMVGCVVLGFALGMETVREFLKGASAMDKIAASSEDASNLPLLSALLGIWNRNFLGYPTYAVIPYSHALRRLSAHLQQCDMESNGKSIDKKGRKLSFPSGPIVWGEPGTCAQHSFYQWMHQGTDIASLEMIGFQKSQYEENSLDSSSSEKKLLANLIAQAIALATGKKDCNPNKAFAGNRPSRLLLAKQLTPCVLGSLLSYFEHRTAFQGFIWDINSFDQEGVQLGKVLATEILEAMRTKKSKSLCITEYLALLKNL